MIDLRRAVALFVVAALAAGCAPPPNAARPPAPTANLAIAPTNAPTTAPTSAPPTSAPTDAPTAAPTSPPPTSAPTDAPTAAPTSPPPTSAPTSPPPQPATSGPFGAEILFLRAGNLLAYDPSSGGERTIADGVSTFAATPDGRQLAIVRAGEIWLVGRDGAGLRQLTSNQRSEGGLSWAPDGMSLAYSSSAGAEQRPLDWPAWSSWCAAAEVRLIDLVGPGAGGEQRLGAGCDPAFAPDGRRVSFASAPATSSNTPGVDNSIQIVNRQGANGWSLAGADGSAEAGMVVYAPAWAPDGASLAYQRFVGYRTLVDINLTELSNSFKRDGRPIGSGAGWLLPPRFAPDGRSVAIVEHNYSDARGLSGYDVWRLYLLRLGETGEIFLPDRTIAAEASEMLKMPRVAGAAWSPDGTALALLLPAGWEPGADPNAPLFSGEGPGAIWRGQVGGEPEELLVEGVDYASPLAWLPGPPDLAEIAGVRLAYPRAWGVREPAGPGELFAGDVDSLVGVASFNLPASAAPADFFPDLVPAGAELGDPVNLPDGSSLRSFRGAGVAGAVRSIPGGDGASVALIYRTGEAAWPLERATALALLGAGGAAPSAQ